MTLSGHLKELRNRIFICLILLAVFMVAGINVSPAAVDFLIRIGQGYGYHFVYISPQELLMQYFSVAFILAVCVTLPVLLYQIWAFASPGLRKNEKLFFFLAMVFGLIFFGLGVYFAYRVMLPFILRFLISLGRGSRVEATVSIQNYLSFLMTFFIIFGAVFELPVLSLLLTQLGFLKVQWMKKFRKVVVVAIFFIAAVITPPDVVSQVMVAIPILILYEFSVVLCTGCERLKRKKKKTG